MLLWLPQIIKAMGSFSDLQVGFLSAISPLLGVAGALYVSYRSDHKGNRKGHMTACYIIAGTGVLASAVTIDNPVAAFVLLSIGNAALLAASPLFWAIGGAFFTGAATAMCVAVANIIAQIGGIGPWLIGLVRDATGSFTLALVAISIFCFVAAGLALAMRPAPRQNSQPFRRSERNLTPRVAEYGRSGGGRIVTAHRLMRDTNGKRAARIRAAHRLAPDSAEKCRCPHARSRAIPDLAQGDLLIDNGKIAQIAARIDASPDSTAIVDLTNRIIIPGFIDTHVHSYQGLLRSLLPGGRVDPEYNRDIQNNLTLHYRPEDVYAGVLITALSQIDNGTTTIVDISQIAHSPEHSDANIQALKDAGIRAVFAYSRGEGPSCAVSRRSIRLRNTYFNSPDQLLTLAMATSVDPKLSSLPRERRALGPAYPG